MGEVQVSGMAVEPLRRITESPLLCPKTLEEGPEEPVGNGLREHMGSPESP